MSELHLMFLIRSFEVKSKAVWMCDQPVTPSSHKNISQCGRQVYAG